MEVDHLSEAGKFVALEGADCRIILFGPPITPAVFYYHLDLVLASREPLLDILGGGHYERKTGGWKVYGKSEKYGACDASVLRQVRSLLKQPEKSEIPSVASSPDDGNDL